MYYERLSIEPADDGWIRFSCPDRTWAEPASSMMELPRGFTYEMILQAMSATGWTTERDGVWRLQNGRSCHDLVRLLDEMLTYFDGPNSPSDELLQIRVQVDTIRADLPQDEAQFGDSRFDLSAWQYARLDILLRENLAEATHTLDRIWERETFLLDISYLRAQVIRNYCREAQAQSELTTGRMSASARVPMKIRDRGRIVG